ncbi:oxidoreductin [Blastomyces dermatitidis ER-3]|uniref:Oxidoreductin n=2 Tax=Ajellomyces dermatitidis TaxID=5039 RepID=F2TMH9_AJEDA|nr:oxidoreductin [Blastomyces dermatitidis ER-3]EEQ84712.2 oxidoreductin [Blastomyces dermatitidis ER-3]EGE84442.1 oxidoreductin [Blastomyces dermatitidis ATCC 18188]
MRSASQLFYLAVFTWLSPVRADSHASKARAHPPSACAIDPKATVTDACASFATLDAVNDKIAPLVQSITHDTDFFSYYRLNLFNKQCPFWSDDVGMCGNIACAVNILDSEDDIPPIWRAEELSKLEGPKAGHPGKKLQQERPKEKPLQGMLGEDVGESCVVEYDDECDQRDYCVPEDEGATAKGDYVSLLDNPERFTGYGGEGARHVWDAIYRENCFLKPLPKSQPQSSRNSPLSNLQAAKDFKSVLDKHGRYQVVTAASRNEPYPLDDECIEKRVFHRIISGMHASISTHLCWDYFNQKTGQWLPNVQCYRERLHDHPERISNLYFNFAVLVRAVSKIQKLLQAYSFCNSDPPQDFDTRVKVLSLADTVSSQPKIFDETTMFRDEAANGLKEDFRNRFRNVSRLMDCIGCDKCRLWGKLQTAGYGAALKILFEFDETKNGENPPLRRTELVALINTLGRVSHSITAVQNFEQAIVSGTEGNLPVHTTLPKASPLSPAGPKSDKGDGQGEEKVNPSRKDQKQDHKRLSVEDLEDDDDEWAQRTTSNPGYTKEKQEDSIMDVFREEFEVVWRTYLYVLNGWIKFPGIAWKILIMELSRLWNFWLGVPVPPRSWEFRFPRRDEL